MKSFLASILLMSILGTAQAGQNTGLVTKHHLNGGPADRGVCVQMQPALSGTGWACLYKNNNLYKEMTAAILAAYIAQKTCSIAWDVVDSEGHALIKIIDC